MPWVRSCVVCAWRYEGGGVFGIIFGVGDPRARDTRFVVAGAAFQNLYDNNYGIGDAFKSFWSTVATRFHNNSNVLAYELLNEVRPSRFPLRVRSCP